jgi:PAS domain S-box-containing protein
VGVSKIARDITDRKRAEQALRESEARFRLAADEAPVLIWMSDTNKLSTYFNTPWLDFTGRSMESELGNGWAEGVHSEDLQRCFATYTRAFDQRQPFRMEYRLHRHDGEYRWVLDVGVPRFNADGSFAGFIGSVVDVTEQRLAQETLDRLGGKLIEAQEKERSRIARELHDDICQRLAILSLEIEHSLRNLDVTPTQAERIQEVWEHCSEIAGDVQALSHELHSSILDHLGMIAAVKNFCSEFSRQQGVVVEFTHEDVPSPLPQDVSLCLFRVVQEALHNAVKHSGVSFFQVRLQGAPDGIDLEVRDAGGGFDVKKIEENGGLGLISMQERIHLVKGTFAIDSQTNWGTTIRARVPLVASTNLKPTASKKVWEELSRTP